LLLFLLIVILDIVLTLLLLMLAHPMLLQFLLPRLINPRKLWTTSNKILHRKISNSLPTCPIVLLLSLIFSLTFFSSKIHKTHTNLLSDVSQTLILIYIALIFLRNLTSSYTCFTYCDLDPILSSLLKKFKFALLPTITNIINNPLLLEFFLINLFLAQFILSIRT
jgi:hypothetical protein